MFHPVALHHSVSLFGGFAFGVYASSELAIAVRVFPIAVSVFSRLSLLVSLRGFTHESAILNHVALLLAEVAHDLPLASILIFVLARVPFLTPVFVAFATLPIESGIRLLIGFWFGFPLVGIHGIDSGSPLRVDRMRADLCRQ